MNSETFLDHAIQYLEASRRLSQSEPFIFKPTFYCAIHSVELALKGHLLHQGSPPEALRKREFGHNIDRLLEQALDDGALDSGILDIFHQRAITMGSQDYSAKCFEYPESMYSTYPIGKWLRIAEALADGLQSKLT
jgi:hypothetical protein